jgi:prophage antirepressor-like protein
MISDGDKTSMIDVEQEIFQFEGHKFFAIFVDNDEGVWDVWIKGSEVAEVLGYANKDQAVRDHVHANNKFSFAKLTEIFDPLKFGGIKNMNKNTIFINLSGFFNLIHLSKKETAVRICQWIDNDVLPSLMRYGIYVMQPAQIKITKLYDREMISKYTKKPVMYIVYVGKYYGIHMFKYGLSRNILRRIYKEHALQFDVCKVIYVDECANCEVVEKLFEEHVISLKLHQEAVINGKNQTELFTVTTKYTHDDAIAEMTRLVANNKLPEVAQAVDKINMLTNVVDIYKHSDEMQKLIIQFMQSDNYRFAVDANLQMAKLDSDT